MTGEKRNLPASVTARLLSRAKRSGDDYQTILTHFCFERFLYRLRFRPAGALRAQRRDAASRVVRPTLPCHA